MKIRTVTELIGRLRMRQARLGYSRYELSNLVAPRTDSTPQAIDRKIARMYGGETNSVDVGFILDVAYALGLELSIGDKP